MGFSRGAQIETEGAGGLGVLFCTTFLIAGWRAKIALLKGEKGDSQNDCHPSPTTARSAAELRMVEAPGIEPGSANLPV